MKKSVFLAYAEDSDEDDTIFSRDQGDKSAKSSKQKQKQKAKKQYVVEQAIKQVTVEEAPPAPVAVVPTATYANASAAAKKTAPAASTSTPPPPPPLLEAPRTQAPPPSVSKPKQQPKVAPKQQQQQVAQKQPPPSPSQPQVEKKSNDKYIPPNARNNPSAQGRQGTPFQSATHLERVASPPPRSTPSSSGVTYVPSHIQVLLPGQMENSQLREHLTQALRTSFTTPLLKLIDVSDALYIYMLVRLEQVEHENRVLQQLNLNLQTEVVALRAPSASAFNHAAAAAVRPPGL
ncbi:hypothetical protein DYB36_012828 [Aphanomyces astaci]|uniref:Uncharacterized protein n=1 Tax=Aphanomyces astaci TaxID=112090 RepID=A0A397B5L3_APHAT|nr:hypothetical protein DYB36_012828 [Aphanomyces astaci]